MAQPLPPEAKRPEAPDRAVGTAGPDQNRLSQDQSDEHPYIRLLQDPPERKVTGPRPRPGVRPRRPWMTLRCRPAAWA